MRPVDTDDSFDLERFLQAQEATFADVLAELRAGRKQSHWMWFIFPQLRGLGSSPTAIWFGIPGLAEATEYLAHPVLGSRLLECTRLVNQAPTSRADEIFGPVDAMKLRSSMTLFSQVAGADKCFEQAIEKLFGGAPDPATLERLRAANSPS